MTENTVELKITTLKKKKEPARSFAERPEDRSSVRKLGRPSF